MNANQLRIGNWVTIGGSKPFQITGIFHEYVWALINETDFPVNDLQPIPLTEEWLSKFKFEYDPEDETWFKDGYFFTKNDEGNLSILEFPEAVAMYVHQLQNLFFCLCGKELEINN